MMKRCQHCHGKCRRRTRCPGCNLLLCDGCKDMECRDHEGSGDGDDL